MSTSVSELLLQVTQLQTECERLTDELSQCEHKAQNESLACYQAQERVKQLEDELTTVQEEAGVLQLKNAKLSSMIQRLTRRVRQSRRTIKKAWSTLYQSGQDVHDCRVAS